MKTNRNTSSSASGLPSMSRRRWLKTVAAAALGGAAAAPLASRALTYPSESASGASSTSSAKKKVSRIAQLQPVQCTECDACMPCGYGIDIPGNFRFYNDMLAQGLVPDIERADRSSSDFRSKARGFLRKYDRTIPDSHQSQRCIKCFHCASECRERVFIVNELAALTALTDELRDWECRKG